MYGRPSGVLGWATNRERDANNHGGPRWAALLVGDRIWPTLERGVRFLAEFGYEALFRAFLDRCKPQRIK